MGMITICTEGSFPRRIRTFSAIKFGHARAVADAIAWLSSEVLPDAIKQDHDLQFEGAAPAEGFGRPTNPDQHHEGG